uniref:hypothetical protein n=1 Tax=Streptomyces sp. NBC_01001 TaxID=2903713 RepID=UPI002F90A552
MLEVVGLSAYLRAVVRQRQGFHRPFDAGVQRYPNSGVDTELIARADHERVGESGAL